MDKRREKDKERQMEFDFAICMDFERYFKPKRFKGGLEFYVYRDGDKTKVERVGGSK